MKYPTAIDPKKIGSYPAITKSGGGYFYDQVLEYSVWIHNDKGDDYYQAFATYEDAMKFSETTPRAEKTPMVLVYQEEYIHEPTPGSYIHIKEPRLTEWRPEWLENSQNTKRQIPAFMKEHQNNH